MKPSYKLVKHVNTAEFRRMAAIGDIVAPGWTSSYRRPGNTVSVEHESAAFAVFGRGDSIYLVATPERELARRREVWK